MGGQIGVESELRHGSTFWFEVSFPMQAAAGVEALLAGVRVLLVAIDEPQEKQIFRLLRARHAEAASGTVQNAVRSIMDAYESGKPWHVILVNQRAQTAPVIDLEAVFPSLKGRPKVIALNPPAPGKDRVAMARWSVMERIRLFNRSFSRFIVKSGFDMP
jgi:hypothetical protein